MPAMYDGEAGKAGRGIVGDRHDPDIKRDEGGNVGSKGKEFSPEDFAGAITYGSDRVLGLLASGATQIAPKYADDLVSCTRICLDFLLDPHLRVCTPMRHRLVAGATLAEAAAASQSHWSRAPVAWRRALDAAATGDIGRTREEVLSFYPSGDAWRTPELGI